MTQGSISKLILTLSGPTIVSQLISIVYNMVDTYFVAKIDTSASAAVSVCFSLMSIINSISFGFAMGANSLLSRKLGAKDNEAANRYATCALVGVEVCIAFVMLFSFLFLRPLLLWMGATSTSIGYAMRYAVWILIGAPISCANAVLVCVLRSEGSVKISTIATIGGAIINTVLDPLLIFVFHMDTAGAALATVLSQCFSFAILVFLLVSGRSIVKIGPRYFSRDIRDYVKVFMTGFPTVCRQGMGSLASALLNGRAKLYGDAAVAAIGIANRIYMLMRQIIIGVGQAFQPVAGYNYGAGYKSRTKKAFWFAVAYGSVLSCTAAVLIHLFAPQIMAAFRDDAEVIAVGSTMLRFLSYSLCILAYSTFVNQLYQCLGYKWTATLLACCRQGIFFVPLVLILPRFLGLQGLQLTQPLADILTAAISVPFNIYFFRKYLSGPDLQQPAKV